MRSRLVALSLATVLSWASFGFGVPAHADGITTRTWTGAGGDNKWSTPGNWDGGTVPAPGNRLVFPAGASQLTSVNDFTDRGFSEFVLSGSGYSLGGNPTYGTSAITVLPSSSNDTISMPLAGFTADVTPSGPGGPLQLTLAGPLGSSGGPNTFSGSGDVLITGPIGDTGLLSQTGTGTVTIQSNSSNTGGVFDVHSGELVVNGTEGEGVNGYGGVLSGKGHIGRLSTGASVTGPAAFLLAPGDPGDRPGSMTIDGFLGDAGLVLQTQLDGPQAATGYDQVNVIGATNLNGAFLDVVPGFQPAIGQQFTIINNDAADPVQGTFDGLPQGAAFGSGGAFFRINYQGGDSNDVVLTAIVPPPVSILTAPGSGGGPNVRSFGGRSLSFFAGSGTGGAHVTSFDMDGDGVDEIITGSGAGVASVVGVYGADGVLRTQFSPYGTFAGGVTVAVGDVNGDGELDILTGQGPGGGADVSIFRPDGTRRYNFYAYNPLFRGGVEVAVGDLNGDGIDEIITGPGSGGGPHVRVFNGVGAPQGGGFFAYDGAFAGGVNVTTADLNGDGVSEIVTGAGPGGGPHVRTFQSDGSPIGGGFFAYDPGFVGGVTVGAFPNFGRGHDDIVTGVGRGGGPNVKGFHPDGSPVFSFFAYDAGFTGGVEVAGAVLNAPQ